MQIKFLETQKKKNSKLGTASFVASTDSPDRYGDVINQRGWNLKSYERNPIVLLNHDSSSLPIGKGKVQVKNGQLVIDVKFDMDDPNAANVARKVDMGFINAVSVGFQPLETIPRKELDLDNPMYSRRGQYFKSAELLEVSIVTIPANSEATMLSLKQFNILENKIRDLVREEIGNGLIEKGILQIEEKEDRIVVHFSKNDVEMEEEKEDESLEEMMEDDEDTEELGYKDEEESSEDEQKSYFDELSTYIAKLL